jgi:hypothetical protein
MVETNFLANTDDSFFSVPKTLISSRNPCVPVSNLSDQPRIVRKGEILGHLIDPLDIFDKPENEKELEIMKKKSTMLAKLIQTQHEANIEGAECASGNESPMKEKARVRTDFGSGVPPSEVNQEAGIHIRDQGGRVPNREGLILVISYPDVRRCADQAEFDGKSAVGSPP